MGSAAGVDGGVGINGSDGGSRGKALCALCYDSLGVVEEMEDDEKEECEVRAQDECEGEGEGEDETTDVDETDNEDTGENVEDKEMVPPRMVRERIREMLGT